MRKILGAAVAAVLLAGPVLADTAPAVDESQARAQASRAAVKEFFDTLKGQLVSAMEAGEPVNAIEVCSHSAMEIAADLSAKKGWRVARTSLKLRNPQNKPDAWEKEILAKFEKRKAAGEDPAKIEDYAVMTDAKGQKVFRYMKAIPTAEKPCLACHGGKLSKEVEASLKKFYPTDKARGYKAGDIRGAFTIVQPVSAQ